MKITRSPERAAVYHTRWIAGKSRGSLLRGTASRYTPVRRSALERGLLREKGAGSGPGLPSTFIQANIERFERATLEQEVIRIFVSRTRNEEVPKFPVHERKCRVKEVKERSRDFSLASSQL